MSAKFVALFVGFIGYNVTGIPSGAPSGIPSGVPSGVPSISLLPTISSKPTLTPTIFPTLEPTLQPTVVPTMRPFPTRYPTPAPIRNPTMNIDEEPRYFLHNSKLPICKQCIYSYYDDANKNKASKSSDDTSTVDIDSNAVHHDHHHAIGHSQLVSETSQEDNEEVDSDNGGDVSTTDVSLESNRGRGHGRNNGGGGKGQRHSGQRSLNGNYEKRIDMSHFVRPRDMQLYGYRNTWYEDFFSYSTVYEITSKESEDEDEEEDDVYYVGQLCRGDDGGSPCQLDLPEGEYVWRVYGGKDPKRDMIAWDFCGRSGGAQEQMSFRVFDNGLCASKAVLPTELPTEAPTVPTLSPVTEAPTSAEPTVEPTAEPTLKPTPEPTITRYPTGMPSGMPSTVPTSKPKLFFARTVDSDTMALLVSNITAVYNGTWNSSGSECQACMFAYDDANNEDDDDTDDDDDDDERDRDDAPPTSGFRIIRGSDAGDLANRFDALSPPDGVIGGTPGHIIAPGNLDHIGVARAGRLDSQGHGRIGGIRRRLNDLLRLRLFGYHNLWYFGANGNSTVYEILGVGDHGYRLLYRGQLCGNSSTVNLPCDIALSPGSYVFRVYGGVDPWKDMVAWEFCSTRGSVNSMIRFTISEDDTCVPEGLLLDTDGRIEDAKEESALLIRDDRSSSDQSSVLGYSTGALIVLNAMMLSALLYLMLMVYVYYNTYNDWIRRSRQEDDETFEDDSKKPQIARMRTHSKNKKDKKMTSGNKKGKSSRGISRPVFDADSKLELDLTNWMIDPENGTNGIISSNIHTSTQIVSHSSQISEVQDL